jgi:ABC-type multidrug transport system fused ATPase/permease subunit
MGHQENLPPFISITSITSKLASYGYALTMLFGVVISFGLVFFIFFIMGITEESLFMLIFLVIPLIFISIIYVKRTLSYTTIIIDDKGIHYFNKFKEEMVEEILWEDFESIDKFEGSIYFLNKRTDSHFFDYDIAAQVMSKGNVRFYWFKLKNEKVVLHEETFQGKHLFSFFYSNRLELIRAFLLGIRHFRPDVKIHPWAFSLHRINQESFEIEYDKIAGDKALAFLVLVIVGLVLFFILVFTAGS